MEILYISRLTSERLINKIFKESGKNPGFAIQKFTRLLARGLVENGVFVSSLSSPPYNKNNTTKRFIRINGEEEKGVKFSYLPVVNIPFIKSVVDFFYVFCYILKWSRNNKGENAVLFDVLNVSACMSGILACRMTKINGVGIVTDMPGLMNSRQTKSLKGSMATFLNNMYLQYFDCYVFLTEQMNRDLNKKRRPYIIMEGIVDSEMQKSVKPELPSKKIVLYAGGLHDRYGLKLLVEGFILANVNESELWLYGNGPFVERLQDYCKENNQIVYKGVRPNNEVVDAELRATLLVNPRPTHEAFTQYSFPSKNVEFMVSGTPVLTTNLPGMPIEYHQYVFLFDQGESVEGFASVLCRVLSLPSKDLVEKGEKAKHWVLENKNNIRQANRIIKLVKESYRKFDVL